MELENFKRLAREAFGLDELDESVDLTAVKDGTLIRVANENLIPGQACYLTKQGTVSQAVPCEADDLNHMIGIAISASRVLVQGQSSIHL